MFEGNKAHSSCLISKGYTTNNVSSSSLKDIHYLTTMPHVEWLASSPLQVKDAYIAIDVK